MIFAVTVDSSGYVYIGTEAGFVWRYTSGWSLVDGSGYQGTLDSTSDTPHPIYQITSDGSGNFYAAGDSGNVWMHSSTFPSSWTQF